MYKFMPFSGRVSAGRKGAMKVEGGSLQKGSKRVATKRPPLRR